MKKTAFPHPASGRENAAGPPAFWRALLVLLLLVVAGLALQTALGTLWRDGIPLGRLALHAGEGGIFHAYLPRENRARLPGAWAGSLEGPPGAEWRWQRRGAKELLAAPGDYVLTSSAVWFLPPECGRWRESRLLLPRAVPGSWFLTSLLLTLLASFRAFPGAANWAGEKAPPAPARLALFLAGAFLFSVWRKPEWLLLPQLANEDLPVFAYESWRDGWSSLVRPYAGYWHMLPRLAAAAFRGLPPDDWPAAYATAAWLLTAALGSLAVFSRVCPDWRARFLMGWALYWVPAGGEVYFQLYNIQWVALGTLFLLLLQPPAPSRLQRGVEAGVVFMLGLTTPGILLAMLWPGLRMAATLFSSWRGPSRAWSETFRWKEEWPLFCCGASAAAIQLFSAFERVAPGQGAPLWTPVLLWAKNMAFIVWPEVFPAAWWPLSEGARWLAALCWLLGLLVLWWRAPSEVKRVACVLCAAGAAVLLLGFLRPAGGDVARLDNFSPRGEGGRYYFFLGLALLWTTVLLAFHQKTKGGRLMGSIWLLGVIYAQSAQMRVAPNADYDWPAQARALGELMGRGAPGEEMVLAFPQGQAWPWRTGGARTEKK